MSAVPPQPKTTDDAVVMVAARKLASDILEAPSEDDFESMANAIRYEDDAFRIAKRLDRAGWHVDGDTVDDLEAAWYEKHQACCVATKAWVAEWSIVPNVAVGDTVTWARSNRGPCVGEITAINEDGTVRLFVEAHGHVRDGLGTHGYIVRWDDPAIGYSSTTHVDLFAEVPA